MFRSVSRCFSCGFLSVLIALTGCGGAPSTSTPPPSQISVSVTPATVTLLGGATQSFTATVLNDSTDAGVSWTATSGNITAAGAYTAPSPVTVATATVTATSKADSTKSASSTVSLVSVALSITPSSPAAMVGGATQSFTATLTSDPANAGVKWTATGGGSFSATSTSSGTATTYAAADPVTSSSATITATSVTYPSISSSVTVPLTPVALSLTSPSSATLDGDGSQSLAISASITGDTSAAGATFTIGGAGGKLSAATVAGNSPSATYTAPVVTSASTATVTVGSVKDPTKTQAVAVTLNPPMMFSTPASLPAAALGAAYTGTSFAVTGGTGSKTFAIKSGTLPSGLSLSSAGVISGTPNGSSGLSTFTISATDQATTPATISSTFTLGVSLPQVLSSSPSSIAFGSPDTAVTLTGTGFGTNSVVYIQGAAQPTTFVSSTSLQVTIGASNLLYQGSLSLTVNNSGFVSNTFSIPLVNPLPVLSSISPSTVIAGSGGFQLTLTGSNFTYGSTVMINGVSHTTSIYNQPANTASVAVTADEVTSVGSLAVTIVNPTPGGGSSAPLQLQLIAADNRVRTLAYSTLDVAVDPVRNLVYASVGSNSTTSPNSLLAIDPKQGTVVTTQAVSDQPGRMAITDDGTYLYVSFPSTGEVSRYTLPTLALDIHWSVTGGAVDLETAPGAPHTVAITSAASAGLTDSLTIYDDGVARANIATGSYPFSSYSTIAWGADASTLYSTNGSSSGGPEYIFHVDQNGPTLTATYSSAFGDFVKQLQFDKTTGLLFDGYGRAVSPANGTLAGQFNVKNTLSYESNPFTVDSKQSRAFFLNSNSFLPQQIAGTEIQAFDLGSYQYINTLLVPGLSGSRILPWGASGLVIGGGDQIYIIDGPFVAAGATPTPVGGYAAASPTLTSISLQNVRAGSASVDVVVTGSGFTQAALATWNAQTLTTTWQSSTQITVTFPASVLTQAISSALTVANGPYQESSNGINFSVLPDLGPNANITELNVSGEDMVWDSTRNLLYVAVTNPAALNGDTVAVIDPTNASLLKTIYTGSQPSVLGISDDNHFLYTGFQTSASIQRYLLPDFTLDLTIPLDSGAPAQSFAGDIKVAPGQNQTIAVSMGTSLLEPRDTGGLAIFDNATRRANVLPAGVADTYKLAWGNDATKLFANSDPVFEPQGFSSISVDATGITSRAGVSALTDLGLRPHFDPVTNLIYSDNGRITNPTTLEAAGVMESSGLMVPDAALNRAFFLRTIGSSSFALDIFDLRRQSLLKSIPITGVTGNATQLVRWGTQGIAFLTDDDTGNGALYLVQGSDISGLTTAPANGITLSPSTVMVGGAAGTLVTVTGTNFLSSATIQVNGLTRSVTYVNSTTLTFALTAADQATAGYLDVTVTDSSAAGTTTPPATLEITNPAPVISSATPSILPVGSYDTPVILSGSGFLPTTTATVNGNARTVTYLSATQLSVLLPSSDFATLGSLALVVSNPAPGGGASAVFVLPVSNPVPTIGSTNPSALATGSAATLVTVFGTGFVSGAVVKVGGAARTTTFVSNSAITFTLTAADLASSGSVSFTVTNPPPGGGSSVAASIAVNNAQLGPITLSPSVVLTGATPPATITINGTNFLAGATVQVNGSARTVTYVSSTQLTFQLTTADQATAGSLYVVVANPSPGVGTVYAVLTVTAAATTPVIASVSPTQFYRGSSGNSLQISGTGLTSNSVAYWNGTALAGSYSSYGSALFVTVPDSLVTASGTASITVSTPSATPSLSNAVSISVVDPIAPTLTSISPNFGPFHTATQVTLTGTNFTNDSVVSINGYAATATVANSTQITLNVTADQLAPGNNIITVNTPAPGGGTSSPQVFTAYVPIANNGMVYNPANQLFYLSVPSSAGEEYGNSIVSIDPVTGTLGNPIFVGSEPNQMAITSDGHYLWVGLDGVGAVRKVDLVANSAGLQFALPNGSSSFMKATTLIAVPGQTDSVVVAASQQSNTFSNTSLAVYDSGVARSSAITASFAYPAFSLQIDGSRGELYAAFQSEYRVYTYNATGLTLKTDFNSTIPVANYVSDRIQLYSGRMYTDYSSVFDAETGVLDGNLPKNTQYVAYAPVAVDSSAGLAFLLNSSQQYSSTPNQIQLANLSDLSATGTAIPVNVTSNLSGPTLPVTSLARWGVDGLAFRSAIAVYPLRSVLVKDLSASPADLGVTLSSSGSATTGAPQTYLATVTNSGPSAASEVALTVTIPSGAVPASVVSSTGNCSTGSVVTCSLGTLASGGSITVTVTVMELTPGSSTLSASVNASQPDPNPANNQASSTMTVTGATYSLAPALTAISPVSVEAGSTDTVITATGQNFSAGATLLSDGVALNTTVVSATQLTAIVPASSLATLGWHQLAVVNPAPGGGTTPPLTLTVFSVIKAGANHILYEPFSRQIYATLGSEMPLGNSVEAIDPFTGNMTKPVFIGSEPTRMALSDNGQVLYALASDANEVVRFNTLNQNTEGNFGLQTGFASDNSAAADMAVQPGTAGDTVVINSGGAQVVDFDPVAKTSTARSMVLATGLVSPRFLNATDVIGYGDYAFSLYAVTTSGLGGTPLSHFTGDASPFKLSNGLAFVNNGTVVDVTSQPNSVVGSFPLNPAYYGSNLLYLEPDTELGRAFFLLNYDGISTYSAGGAPTGLAIFDTKTFAGVGYVPLDMAAIEPTTFNPSAVDVVRWGQDGIAGLTNSGNIYLVRGPAIVPQLLETQTAPVLSSNVSGTLTHGSGNTVLTLSGSNFLPGIAVTWNGSYRTTLLVDGTHLAVDLPASDLAASGTASIVATNPGSAASAAITVTIP